jgi:hypothetical protein
MVRLIEAEMRVAMALTGCTAVGAIDQRLWSDRLLFDAASRTSRLELVALRDRFNGIPS